MFAILKPVTFGVLYTLGNIISLASTGFLVGPMKQVKQMFAEKRIIATIVFLSALVLTLVVAIWVSAVCQLRSLFVLHSLSPQGGKKFIPLIIVLIVFQFFALVWYSASYIPFARSAIKTCVTSCLSK